MEAGLLQPHQHEARAADAHVPAHVEEQVVQPQRGGQGGVGRAVGCPGKVQGGGQAQKIAGVDLRDVPGEGDAQQVVGAAPDRLPLGHRLLGPVVVVQPLPPGPHLHEERLHRLGEGLLRQGTGANDVLFQKKTSLFRFPPL